MHGFLDGYRVGDAVVLASWGFEAGLGFRVTLVIPPPFQDPARNSFKITSR